MLMVKVVDVPAKGYKVMPNIEHALEVVSKAIPTGHNWVQKGIYMCCDGSADHFAHAFRLPPELVFVAELEDGSLQFKNVKTGELTTKLPS
jgi:hypothetical protein